jgi:hypothetical protein
MEGEMSNNRWGMERPVFGLRVYSGKNVLFRVFDTRGESISIPVEEFEDVFIPNIEIVDDVHVTPKQYEDFRLRSAGTAYVEGYRHLCGSCGKRFESDTPGAVIHDCKGGKE